jgi:hypothetical protein
LHQRLHSFIHAPSPIFLINALLEPFFAIPHGMLLLLLAIGSFSNLDYLFITRNGLCWHKLPFLCLCLFKLYRTKAKSANLIKTLYGRISQGEGRLSEGEHTYDDNDINGK